MDWGNLISGGVGSLIGALATWGTQELNSKRQTRASRKASKVKLDVEALNLFHQWAQRVRDQARTVASQIQSGNFDDGRAIQRFAKLALTSRAQVMINLATERIPALGEETQAFVTACIRLANSYGRAAAVQKLLAEAYDYRPELRLVEESYRNLKAILQANGWKYPWRSSLPQSEAD